MTCTDCRDLLPLHLYGDLSDVDRAAVAAHLSGCAACAAELAALARTRAALDAAPVLVAPVDVNRIFRTEAERQRRAARRWRVAAVVGTAAALLLAATRLDVTVHARQFTVRWGAPEVAPVLPSRPADPPTQTVVVRTEQVPAPHLEDRLDVLTALIHALAANVESGDRERADELTRLRQELAGLRRHTDRKWLETERNVTALYAVQFGPKPKEDKP